MCKVFSGLFVLHLTEIINDSIATSPFPYKLRLAEVMSTCKKDDLRDTENYRPVISLFHMSKIFFARMRIKE